MAKPAQLLLQPPEDSDSFLWSSHNLPSSRNHIHEDVLITLPKCLDKTENHYVLTLNYLLIREEGRVRAGLQLRNPCLELLPNLGFSLSEHARSYTFYCTSLASYNSWISKLKRVCVSVDFEADYSFGMLIGRGGFSKVYLGIRRKDGAKRAIKIVKKKKLYQNIKNRMLLIKEIEIMRRLEHPRIIKLYAVYETDKAIYLVTEYIEGGELLQRVNNNGPFSEKGASMVIKCVLEALEYCHKNNIVHRDLKLENLILV
eukprot:TRINITY_DN6160_c0_g1_i2.p1 TRINITY_DN6160_c0_g1~~TRINITY_DN6160_c0_g1_i2.p1  ORF type:complete len:258 (+),score=44.05 TRINITY_DN6160_c0_g1_i2:197-970(+)